MRRHALTALAFPLVSALVVSPLLPSHAAAKAPVARRYVAILKERVLACPAVPGWTQSSLFDPSRVDTQDRQASTDQAPSHQPKPQAAKDKGPVPPPSFNFAAFRRFCQYTLVGQRDVKTTPPAHKDFLRVDPDYDVLVPQGSLGQDSAVRESLNQIYRAMLDLGPIASAKTQPLYTSGDSKRVAQVVVIDTAGDKLVNSTRRATHGLAMAEIIREVRCPAREPACREHLSFQNAFPWSADTAALPDSSSEPLGSLGSLAAAIFLAVSSWRLDNFTHNTDAPLILNLSLGWDPGKWAPADWQLSPWDIPTKQGDETLALRRAWPTTAQAVHAALLYASCFDVLAIAAAGNNTRGAELQTGALAPAKWEKLLAPDKETCKGLFGDAAQRTGNDTQVERKPLVYAVRARMTGNGNALASSRQGSTSLQISPASHVVAGVGRGRTAPWSGSSVAAATYSGLAAALWSYDRRLTPHQVMTLIYRTGEDTTMLYPGKEIYFHSRLLQGDTVETPTSEPRAASPNPFAAFKKLCPTGCGYSSPYKEVPNEEYYRWYEPLKSTIAQKITSISPLSEPYPGPTLTPQVYTSDNRTHYYPDPGAAPVPTLSEAASARPWTRPQPQTPICPVCLVSDKTLILSLSEVPAELKQDGEVVLDNPLLEFNLRADDGFIAVSLGQLTVGPNGLQVPLDRYKIKLGGDEMGLGTALRERSVDAGTLTIFLKDPESSEPRANVSIIQVLPTP